MIVEVAFLPALATGLGSKLCVVIDVLRATSTLVTMFGTGVRRVILSESIPSALELAGRFPERPKVCGESGGTRPAGFDMGNSPREFLPGSLEGKEIVFCTSNGTRAARAVANAPVVLAGSMLNGSALARTAFQISAARGLDLLFVCSGDYYGTKFAIDDAFCTGHLVTLVQREAQRKGWTVEVRNEPSHTEDAERTKLIVDESAVAAQRIYRSYGSEPVSDSPDAALATAEGTLQAFWQSHNALVLRRVGLSEDVEFCARQDVGEKVPRLRLDDGLLVFV